MIIEIAAGGFLLGEYVYHRWIEEHDKPKPISEFEIPRVDQGAAYPIFHGRCRVDAPVLAWVGTPDAREVSADDNFDFGVPPGFTYGIDMFFQIGIPFFNGTNRIHAIYAGDHQLEEWRSSFVPASGSSPSDPTLLSELEGTGHYERDDRAVLVRAQGDARLHGINISGEVEFLNGNGDGTLTPPVGNNQRLWIVPDISPVADTLTAEKMMDDGIDGFDIPGYRKYVSALLTRLPIEAVVEGSPSDVDGFIIGMTPTVPTIGFEVSSYRDPCISGVAGEENIDGEANPADAIYDLLTAIFGKLGLPVERIDLVTFAAVASVLAAEGHGYSRAVSDVQDAEEVINEICKQIDAVVYEDPADLKIKIKLIRGDYDPATVPVLTPDNCRAVKNAAAGGWVNLVNKIRVVFLDRQERYKENSAIAHNLANAVGQDGQVREVVLRMPGVCNAALAEEIASRELSIRSRPVIKCRAIADRTFRNVVVGDVVALVWPDDNIDGLLFRVANAERGTLENGEVALDLLQDFFFEDRGTVFVEHPIAPFPVVIDPGPD